jgi:alpha-glucoside transport system substrate-binding protein
MRLLRWRGPLALLAALALVAAGCRAEEGGEGAEETATADLSGESIEVAATWTGAEQDRFEAVLDAFAQETGAEVQFRSAGDDVAAYLGPRIEGGDPPDVAMLPQPGLLRDYVEQGVLQPLDDVVGDELGANFAPAWQEFGTVDGTLYGVYWKASQKSTFWYNTNVFAEVGVEPPADWDGLQQTAQAITDFGTPAYSIGAGDGWTLTDWFENIYIRTAGPDAYDQLATHEIPWTDDSVAQALEVFAQVVSDPDQIAGGIDGALQTDFNTSVTQVFADPPAAGMVYEGDFVGGIVSGETRAEVGTDADFFNFPSIEGSPESVIVSGDAAVLLKDTEGGKALIEFLATPEAAEIWAREGGFISPNINVDLSVYPDEISRRAAEAVIAAAEADNLRYDMADLQPSEFGATTGEGLWGILQEFIRNPDDIDGITQQLEDAAAQAYGS